MGCPPRLSSNRYGWYMEESGINNYVECQSCLHRIVGGTEDTRLQRFIDHTIATLCRAGGRAVESQHL